jgi:hypothetical protein
MKDAAREKSQRLAKPELFVTVFVTGAAVMVIEIMGTRIIGPVFGIGLFVWSALLTVTLGALAVGYYAGGVLADRVLAARCIHTPCSPWRASPRCRREPRP